VIIAVVGAGIGGLAAAAFLHQAGVPVTVYEQARALTEAGSGLIVAPNAGRLLRRLGVLDEALTHAVRLDGGALVPAAKAPPFGRHPRRPIRSRPTGGSTATTRSDVAGRG
jgi:2-polyprenyl-6-methoxyphenol hydroxylase-like FAD-dependent oxidoreductase